MAGEKVAFEGLPARICWPGYGERHPAGLEFNEMVAAGELSRSLGVAYLLDDECRIGDREGVDTFVTEFPRLSISSI